MSNVPSPTSPQFVETAATAAGRWAIYRWPLARACACSMAGHALGIVVLAMTFTAAKDGPAGLSGLLAGAADRRAADLEELDAQTAEPAEAMSGFSPQFNAADAVSQPVLELGQVQASLSPDLPSDGGLMGLLAAEVESAAQAADRPLGNSANFYGIEADGANFVFVVDMSGSMNGSRFRRAKSEVWRSIEALASTQRYFVIFFSDHAWPMPAREMIEATPENLSDTRRWLKQAACQGGTNPLPALLDAIDLDPDAIFLLSDGKFDLETALEVTDAETSPPIPIHTIGFASREGEPMLRAISKATGGTYRFVR